MSGRLTSTGEKRLFVYVAFILCACAIGFFAPGDDLLSSYIGCRLLASGNAANLFDFHPDYFNVVGSAPWMREAAEAGYFLSYPHPYVQTPLWAWILRPLCMGMSFNAFRLVFLAAMAASLAAMVEIVARNWANLFLRPAPLAVLLTAVTLSTPLLYAVRLVQTHALFLTLAVAALIEADKNRPARAGGMLAAAAAVKITPGLLIVYWLFRGRYRAALWFLAFSALVLAATPFFVGLDLTRDYFRSMSRVSNVLLIAFNNQSFAAWLSYSDSMASELGTWRIMPLPTWLKLASTGTMVCSLAALGLAARSRLTDAVAGAIALIMIVIFSPIAWSHYFLVLAPAIMVLFQFGGILAYTTAVAVFLLNSLIFTFDAGHPGFYPWTIVRGQFLSAVLLACMLLVVSLRRNVKAGVAPATIGPPPLTVD